MVRPGLGKHWSWKQEGFNLLMERYLLDGRIFSREKIYEWMELALPKKIDGTNLATENWWNKNGKRKLMEQTLQENSARSLLHWQSNTPHMSTGEVLCILYLVIFVFGEIYIWWYLYWHLVRLVFVFGDICIFWWDWYFISQTLLTRALGRYFEFGEIWVRALVSRPIVAGFKMLKTKIA